MNILFIDTAHELLIRSLRSDGHTCTEGYSWSRKEILERINEYDGVCIRSRIQLDKEFFDQASHLRFVARAGAGLESIDVKYAERRGVKILSSPEGNRDAVAEHAIAMLLGLFNKINKADREVRSGKWVREENRGVELTGKTVGIIGYGNMGSTFAKRLRGFECTILAYDKYLKNYGDPFVTESGMEVLFEQADIVSLHVPLTTETEYMVNEAFISTFRKPVYLVNTARGKCVSIRDLVSKMRAGKIRGACLDVLEYEDTSFEKFSIEGAGLNANPDWQYLIQSDNVVLSPHIAGWTVESLRKIAEVLVGKIRVFNV